MIMYNRIRQIHLFAAFVLTTFVLMYFITGVVMIFEHQFERRDNSVVTQARQVPGVRHVVGDELVKRIREEFLLRGQYQVRQNGERTIVTFRHPGLEANAVVNSRSDTVTVTTRKKNLVNVLHQFHRLHGYYGGWNYLAWAFVYDLSSVSMILFALTGLYLWYRTERVRWPGWTILLVSTVFVIYTLIYLSQLK